jgi:hypothetical protein
VQISETGMQKRGRTIASREVRNSRQDLVPNTYTHLCFSLCSVCWLVQRSPTGGMKPAASPQFLNAIEVRFTTLSATQTTRRLMVPSLINNNL